MSRQWVLDASPIITLAEIGRIHLLCDLWEALVDDRAARNCGRSLKLPCRGTVGVILLAKREGCIGPVRPVLENVVEAGLHVSEHLFQRALQLADED